MRQDALARSSNRSWNTHAVPGVVGGSTWQDAVTSRMTALCPALRDVIHLERQFGAIRNYNAHAQIAAEGELPAGTRAVVSGWAGVVRIFSDGRRQIQHLIAPGDLIAPAAGFRTAGAITALTPVVLAAADGLAHPDNAWGRELLQRHAALTEQYLLNQVARLGRQLAYERVAHLLLELRDRLRLAGLGDEQEFRLPLTQEILADTLGLTSVHMNRTLQALRRDHLLEIRSGTVKLLDLPALARAGEYHPPVVLA